MLNLSILNIATKLYIKLRSGNSDTVAMHTRSFRMGVVTGLLLIAGLLPMLAAAQTPTGITLSVEPATVTESSDGHDYHGYGHPDRRHIPRRAVRPVFQTPMPPGGGAGTATPTTDYTSSLSHHGPHHPREYGKRHRGLHVHGEAWIR